MRELLLSFRSVDTQLHHFIALYGKQIYFILFLIIFAKTAYVVFTFLPGDATLFASGTIAAVGQLDIRILLILFFVSTIAGDVHNFYLGKLFKGLKGKQFRFSITRFIPEKAIHKASQFLDKYGKFTIILSRFIPLLAASVPFVSGFTSYRFKKFFSYNVFGAFLWTFVWVIGGYSLGNTVWVSQHVTLVLTTITILTYLPPISIFIYNLFRKSTNA